MVMLMMMITIMLMMMITIMVMMVMIMMMMMMTVQILGHYLPVLHALCVQVSVKEMATGWVLEHALAKSSQLLGRACAPPQTAVICTHESLWWELKSSLPCYTLVCFVCVYA